MKYAKMIDFFVTRWLAWTSTLVARTGATAEAE